MCLVFSERIPRKIGSTEQHDKLMHKNEEEKKKNTSVLSVSCLYSLQTANSCMRRNRLTVVRAVTHDGDDARNTNIFIIYLYIVKKKMRNISL